MGIFYLLLGVIAIFATEYLFGKSVISRQSKREAKAKFEREKKLHKQMKEIKKDIESNS